MLATNAAGDSEKSQASVPVTPDVAPEVPGKLTVKSDDRTITATWLASRTEGTEVKQYLATVEPAPPGGKSEIPLGPQTLTLALTGLDNGTEYTVTVRAQNQTGTSSDPATGLATPSAKPSVPQGLDITSSELDAGTDKVINLIWKPSADNGAEVSYSVHWTRNGVDLKHDDIAAEKPLNDQLKGVQLGDTYGATVRALNVRGETEPSTAVTIVPKVLPFQVQGLTASPTGETRKVTVGWQTPANSGEALDRFELTVNGQRQRVGPSATSVTVDAPNGQQATFSILGCTETACSKESKPATAIPYGPAGPVKDLTADTEAAAGTVTLQWAPPADNGGRAVQGYQVSRDAGAWRDAGGGTFTDSGVDNGQRYSYRVRSYNDQAGDGKYGEPKSINAVPYTAPAKPTLTSVSASGVGEATLKWTKPADDGGRQIKRYEYQRDGNGNWNSAGTGSTFVVDTLSKGNHQFVLRTVSEVGAQGPRGTSAPSPSRSVSVYGPVGAVRNPNKETTGNSVRFYWSAPADNGVAGWRYSVDGGAHQQAREKTFTVACGTTKSISVVAFDSKGNRGAATAISKTMPACPPAGSVTLQHGGKSPSCGGCYFLGFRYQDLPSATYRMCFVFNSSSAGKGCWRPSTPDDYNSTLSGSGTWSTKTLGSQFAYYGERSKGHVTITNLKTGKKYTSAVIDW